MEELTETVAGQAPSAGTSGYAARLLAPVLIAVSAVFHYLGPAFAVLLFARLDVFGVAWLRIASAALVFAVWRRPWRLVRRLTATQRRVLLALGVVLAMMNTTFYLAIARLPLATVGSVEFLGVILLAAAGVRTLRNTLALGLAVAGVFTLTGIRLTGEPIGFGFAFANCALFMLYLTLGHRVATTGTRDGARWGGVDQARRCHADRRCRDHAAGPRRRRAGLRPPRLAARRCRGWRLLLGHPVRDRPARHGPGTPGDLRVDAEHLAGLRHGHRHARPHPTADGP